MGTMQVRDELRTANVMGWSAIFLAIFLLGLGCGAHHQEKGDRAMELGDYSRAMSYYEAAIDEGTQDPDLYYRAALSAQRLGAFAKAERYFSQSLRYGGDDEVARTLAEFYIQTSNFGQAAKVFQYLAGIEEDDIQPLYSNIGTALMYAGNYLEAESYLLLAQQMKPSDPVPHINLGVLYDRHLRNLPRAIRFYECYTELSNDASQVQHVSLRLRELGTQQYIDTSRVTLECGEQFRVGETERHDLREVFDLESGEMLSEQDAEHRGSVIGEGLNLDLPLDYDASQAPGDEESNGDDGGERESILVESLGTGTDSSQDRHTGGELLERAREDVEAGRFDAAVEGLEELAEEERTTEHNRLLGKSYYGMGRFQQAADILEEVLTERPSPAIAKTLIAAYEREDDNAGKQRVCERFSGWPDYEEALESCE